MPITAGADAIADGRAECILKMCWINRRIQHNENVHYNYGGEMKSSKLVILLVALSFVGSTVLAGSAAAQEMKKETDWEFLAEIYLWGASLDGKTVSGSKIEADFGDIVDNLNMGFMGLVGARKGKWSVWTDMIYLDVEGKGEVTPGLNLDAELSGWVVTPAVGYNLVESENARLDILGGARYLYLDLNLDLGPLGAERSSTVWDAIVGLKGTYNLAEKWYLAGYLDVGGGGSDLTWQAFGGVGYKFSKVDLILAYRYLSYNFDDQEVLDDLTLQGPFVGFKFVW